MPELRRDYQKRMVKRPLKMRSAPLYIQADGETISIVSEVVVFGPGSKPPVGTPTYEVIPRAIHVIDNTGVHSIPVYPANRARILRLSFVLLIAPLQYALFKRRGEK